MNASWLKTHVSLLFFSLFIVCASLYFLHVWKTKSILWGDTRYYYSITRSIAIDHDLNFENEAFLDKVGFPNQPVFSAATNRVVNKFSPGAPLLWLPAFFVGQALTFIQNLIQPVNEIAGYNWLTQFTVGVATVVFSVVGLYLFFLSLKNIFGVRIALVTSAALFLSTQLFFYTALDPLNSHSASFLFSSLLFYCSIKWLFKRDKINLLQVIILGIIAGWLALIRNQDVIFCAPIALAIFFKTSLTRKNAFNQILKIILFAGAAILPILIQLSFTHYLYGQWNSGYALGGEKLNWFHPDFIRVLFSQGNGFLFFAPIVLFCLWGLVRAARRRDIIAAASLLVFVLATYVIASWGREILGGPYGSRMFTSSLPWLGYGAAVLLKEYWPNKKARRLILLLIFVCSINTIGQTFYMLLTH